MPDVEISVVVAAYNASEWIRDCIESIIGQSASVAGVAVPPFEIIVVDDGSSDNTPEILDELMHNNNCVRVIRQENAGVSAARNAGIRAAAGNFICFIDADDMLRKDAFSIMWKFIDSFGGNTIVIPGECYAKNTKKWLISANSKSAGKGFKLFSGKEIVKECLYRRVIEPDMHGALIPAKIFSDYNAYFRAGRYEDLDLFYRLYLKAEAVVVLKNKLYFYREHAESFINKFSRDRLHVLEVTERIRTELQYDYSLEIAAIDRQISACFNILGLMNQYRKEVSPDMKEELNEAEKRIMHTLKNYRLKALLNPRGRLINKPMLLTSFFGKGMLKSVLSLKRFR